MKNRLINAIGGQLNIPRSGLESICQIVYSVAGQMALASLWDYDEEQDSVSVQHFKNRVIKIIDAYIDLFPEISPYFLDDKTGIAEDIYTVYLHNGLLYHSANRVSPVAYAEAVSDNICLLKGASPDLKLFMSGLGFYSAEQRSTERTIANLFGLQKQSFESYLEELLSYDEWKEITWSDNTEFLRLDLPFSRGYWQQEPNYDDRISIARFGEPNRIYTFYRYYEGVFQHKSIPVWRLKDYFTNAANDMEYIRIAVALLNRYGTLPKIQVKETGNQIELKVGYRFPPSEEYFFRLYSWPMRYDFEPNETQVFTRKMSKQIYPVFKKEISSIGYQFVEEQS